ncbi:MAG: sugar transferase [Pseudomonadota bacterium]
MGKRLFDFALAALLSVLLAPFLTILVLWLLFREGRPVFYPANRMRNCERSFVLWKLRTMKAVEQDAGVSGGDKAQRITPTGLWLRRFRLDELPQLWNILKGDMSFVGPRPPLRDYVERFPTIYRNVLRSRPGITGLATLHFHRREARLLSQCRTAEETDLVYTRVCVPRKARLDMIYQRHASLTWDIALLLATLKSLLRSRAR